MVCWRIIVSNDRLRYVEFGELKFGLGDSYYFVIDCTNAHLKLQP
jgi:hypothetical protein